MKTAYLLVPFAPLVGSMLAGFAGRALGRTNTHRVAILGVLVSLLASLWVMNDVWQGNTFNGPLYTWAIIGELRMEVGFQIDQLTAMMMVVVIMIPPKESFSLKAKGHFSPFLVTYERKAIMNIAHYRINVNSFSENYVIIILRPL